MLLAQNLWENVKITKMDENELGKKEMDKYEAALLDLKNNVK
jgi:hypothetical protein